jgi:formate-dependent nitrite reductase membrane component NrfD
LAPLFWLLAVVVGIVVPFGLGATDRFQHKPARLAAAAAMTLCGGLALRFCLLAVAAQVPITEALAL